MAEHLPTRRLGATHIETTILGFGCADLFREPSRSGRRRLLDAAFDAGIRHFDVAPMYGLGLVEDALGVFARGRRDKIVIATKFGIDIAPLGRAIAPIQGPIQRVLRLLRAPEGPRASAGADPRSGAVGSRLYRPNDYSARAARASLERSLRALRTDYVDLLFVHDPVNAAEVPEDVGAYLESARAAGRIRAWGVAGEPATAVAAARRLAARVPVLQVRGDRFSRMSIPDGIADARILFGVIGRSAARILDHLRADDRARRRWSDQTGADCGDPEQLSRLLLRDALGANPEGCVLFSTTRPGRIAAAAAAAATAFADDPAVAALRALVDGDLGARRGQA